MSHGPSNVEFGKEGSIRYGDEIRVIPTFSVKYVDVFNLKNLYVMMHELLLEEGWTGFEGVDDGMAAHSDLEVLYSENIFQKGIHKGGKEIWIWWRAQKDWIKGASYFKNILNIDWHVVAAHEIEIVHQGKKMKVYKAEIEVFFSPKIMGDVGQKWAKHPLLRHFKPFYEQRIQHGYIEKREKELWRDVYRISNKMKAYLSLKTWMNDTHPFHANKQGWEGEF